MASRKLTDLHPELLKLTLDFIEQAENNDLDILIYCTYRSDFEQNQLYNIGRKTKGQIRTWAKAGESKHNHTVDGHPAALAFDCVPMINGKPYWYEDEITVSIWACLSKIAKNLGLEWAGNWGAHKRELFHFQLNLKG